MAGPAAHGSGTASQTRSPSRLDIYIGWGLRSERRSAGRAYRARRTVSSSERDSARPLVCTTYIVVLHVVEQCDHEAFAI
jgi:hypothetical protein